jgi:2,4-dienoyl-CoA reductase (NADPH2)
MMRSETFPNLMSVFTIAGMQLRNRITMAPMSSALASADNKVSERQIAYFRARAAGGCAMITVEFTCVDPRFGLSEERQLVLADESALPGHRALVNAIHAEGAKVALQLQMPGQYADPRFGGPAMPTAPSDVFHPKTGTQIAAALSHEQIAEIIENFGRGAALAVAAGYDAIELHAAHGYLIAAFLSPLQNRRDDAWGGDGLAPAGLSCGGDTGGARGHRCAPTDLPVVSR